jgi:hypothetical protein
MSYQCIEVSTEAERVGLVRLNRPKQLNALNGELMDELGAALRLREEAADCRGRRWRDPWPTVDFTRSPIGSLFLVRSSGLVVSLLRIVVPAR